MYQVAEDSQMLGQYVKKFARDKVLEIGCGSGVLMEIALENTSRVEGVDIDRESVNFCREKGLSVRKGDLFDDIFRKYDVIIFNPPYLPLEKGMELEKNRDLFGGKKGYEVIERFFDVVNNHLEKKGSVLMLFSSLTNKKKVDAIIKKNKLQFELLEEKSVGLMEKLYVYLVSR